MPSPPSPRTVMIAEDNTILLQGLERALVSHGFDVTTAGDGPTVLQALEDADRPPDLLLLDVMMPGMSGIDVLRRLRADPRWRSLPVLLITAATDEALALAARECGALDVLLKPFRLNELLARVQAHPIAPPPEPPA